MRYDMRWIILFISMHTVTLLFAQDNTGKVKLMVEDGVNYFREYDAQERLTKIKSNGRLYDEIFIYKPSESLVLKYGVEFFDTMLLEKNVLNSKGLVIFKTTYNVNGLVLTCNNEYDENDFLIKQTVQYKKDRTTVLTTIKDGNIFQQNSYDTIFDGDKFQVSHTIINSFYSDKPNPITFDGIGQNYLGASDKNLIVSNTVEIQSSDYCDSLPCPYLPEKANKIEYKFEYTFNSNGQLKECKTIDITHAKVSVKTYYYY